MTYRGGRPVSPDDDLLGEGRIGYVATVDREVCGAMTVLDMDCTRDANAVSNGGVCAVGVLPHKRRLGVGSRLMSESLRLMKEDGYACTSLYAYREPFYRKFGFEVCGTPFIVRCPVERLPKVADPLPIRQLGVDEIDALKDCFGKFCRRYSGMNTRHRPRWWPSFGGEHPCTIFAAGDPVEAYAIIRLEGDFWVDQEIRELVWSSDRGYASILDLLAGVGLNKTGFTWVEPAGSPLLTRYFDQGIEVKLKRPVMYRILDLPACLQALRPLGRGSLVMECHDGLCPWNEGHWRVDFGVGAVEVSKISPGGDADLEMDVRALTQAWLGEPSLADLLNEGYANLKNPVKIEEALALFRPCRTYCAETF